MRTALALLLLAGTLPAAEKEKEPLKSGCDKGAGVDAFNVLDVTGPNAGRRLCYI